MAESIGFGTVHGYGWTARVEVLSSTESAGDKAAFFTVRYVKSGREQDLFVQGDSAPHNLEGDRLTIDKRF